MRLFHLVIASEAWRSIILHTYNLKFNNEIILFVQYYRLFRHSLCSFLAMTQVVYFIYAES
ncbi:MAG: hypothetical protein HDT10_08735 [Helicobacter sp.]|nr:hypothetical protein [Helicobacter sp.]